jgi:PAS domain S-box-containing protein
MLEGLSPPSEEDLRRLFDRSPTGMYRSNAAGAFRFVNPALVAMLGYASADELMAKNLGDDVYSDPDDRHRLIEHYRTQGIVDGVKVVWRTRDGRILTVRVYGHVVHELDDTYFDTTVIDVTALEEVERQMAAQRAELEHTATTLDLVLRQMPAVFWVIDRELKIVNAGGATEAVFGIPRDRYLAVTLRELHAGDPNAEKMITPHLRALGGEIVSYENSWGGRELAVTIGPLRDSRGQVIGAIGTSVDITAVRQLERKMIDAQRAESLGVLAGGLAHDFNNLLVAILGNADLAVREVPERAPGRGALDNIRNAALRAAALTTQLLTFSGRGAATVGRVALAPIVDELRAMLAPSLPEGVALHRALPVDLTPLKGDATGVGQVVLNLITNARDALAGAAGEIVISARAAVLDGEGDDGVADPDVVLAAPSGRYVVIAVADTGPGIDAATRRRIFEPFFTTKATGHGLGLASVLGIVRAHGGGLRLVSEPGAGARFEVQWPAAEVEVATPTLATGSSPATRLRTVLVIDDEEMVRDVVARMVEDLGYAALTAANGQQGLDLLATEAKVDAVVVDLTMPMMNGADVIAAVRKRRPTLPIVVCSGYDRDQRGGGATGDAYLAKPFRLDALEQTLERLIPGGK